jgi:two-component sensor histidine kinase
VEVLWTRDDKGGRPIRWQEDGGPAVVQPEHTGLGSRVLARALAPVPGGRTQLFWRAEGLVCEFDLPPEGQQDSGGSIDEQMAVAGLQQRQGVPR